MTALQLLWDYEKNITDPAEKSLKRSVIEKIKVQEAWGGENLSQLRMAELATHREVILFNGADAAISGDSAQDNLVGSSGKK